MGSEVEKPRAVRLLPQLRVASPCGERWSDMTPGADARTRHCGACRCDVHDISAMTAEAAEEFLQQKVGTDICVRLYQRADGTILTREDCSVGASRKRRRRVAIAIAVAGTAALTAALAPAGVYDVRLDHEHRQGRLGPGDPVCARPATATGPGPDGRGAAPPQTMITPVR